MVCFYTIAEGHIFRPLIVDICECELIAYLKFSAEKVSIDQPFGRTNVVANVKIDGVKSYDSIIHSILMPSGCIWDANNGCRPYKQDDRIVNRIELYNLLVSRHKDGMAIPKLCTRSDHDKIEDQEHNTIIRVRNHEDDI